VTGELSATADYTLPHSWARGLHPAGFTGVHYRIRHDPRANLTGIAWFGVPVDGATRRRVPAGRCPPACSSMPPRSAFASQQTSETSPTEAPTPSVDMVTAQA